MWIFKHRAWAEHIVVKRHIIVVCHEYGALQAFKQCLFPDIGVRVMDENAGIHISVGIDMEISPSACNAAAHIFRVILKIHGK